MLPVVNMEESISWFQTKIGNYDKQSWEKNIEQRILHGLETRPKKESTLNTNLLDVDLIRGTAFMKAKPKHILSAVLWRGLKTSAFASIYWEYWSSHTSSRIAAYIMFHFAMQLLQVICFILLDPKSANVTLSDVIMPLAMGLCLGILHAQITSHAPQQTKNSVAATSSLTQVPQTSVAAASAKTSNENASRGPTISRPQIFINANEDACARQNPSQLPNSHDGTNPTDMIIEHSRHSSYEEADGRPRIAVTDDNFNNQAYNRTVSRTFNDATPSDDHLLERPRALSLKLVIGRTPRACEEEKEVFSEGDPDKQSPIVEESRKASFTGHDADVESDRDEDDDYTDRKARSPSSPPRFIRKRSASLGANFCYHLPKEIELFRVAKMLGISDSEVFARVCCKPTKKATPGAGGIACATGHQQSSPRLNTSAVWRNHLPKMEDDEEDDDDEEEEDAGDDDEEDVFLGKKFPDVEETLLNVDVNDFNLLNSNSREHGNRQQGYYINRKNGLWCGTTPAMNGGCRRVGAADKREPVRDAATTMLLHENGVEGRRSAEDGDDHDNRVTPEAPSVVALEADYDANDTFTTRRLQKDKFLRLFRERAAGWRHLRSATAVAAPPCPTAVVPPAANSNERASDGDCNGGCNDDRGGGHGGGVTAGYQSAEGTSVSRLRVLSVSSSSSVVGIAAPKKSSTAFRSGQKCPIVQTPRSTYMWLRPENMAIGTALENIKIRAPRITKMQTASETECDRMNSDIGSEYDSTSVSDEDQHSPLSASAQQLHHHRRAPSQNARKINTDEDLRGPESSSAASGAALHVATSGLNGAVEGGRVGGPNVSPRRMGVGGDTGVAVGVMGDLEQSTSSTNGIDDPFALWYMRAFQGMSDPGSHETVWCYIWEGTKLKKVNLTLLDIGWSLIQAVERQAVSFVYPKVSCVLAVLMALLPLIFHACYLQPSASEVPTTPTRPLKTSVAVGPLPESEWMAFWQLHHPAEPRSPFDTPGTLLLALHEWLAALVTEAMVLPASTGCFYSLRNHPMWRRFVNLDGFVIGLGMLLRFNIYCSIFFLLCVAERTFQQRLLYAKNFFALTSTHWARKFRIPHLRLNKVAHVKCWLTLRSYLKKQGPQRSVECIITASFYLAFIFGLYFCGQFLMGNPSKRSGVFSSLAMWDVLACTAAVSIFLMRFLTLGTKIAKKYKNVSVLITEQMNLYLSMESKPHKKEELSITNQVLRLAESLLKEIDGPYRISGWAVNPVVYNLFKLVLLSCFSAFVSELLGFKLKLYKLKLNPANW